jgi:hypothetical protein
MTDLGDLMAAFTPLGGPGTVNKEKMLYCKTLQLIYLIS